MKDLNIENEQIKRRYLSFLRDAQGKDEKTIDKVAAALATFESSTRWKSFGKFHIEQAKAFKRDLVKQKNARTGKPLAKGTINATLMHLKSFFVWLADQPGFRSRISYSDAAYFTPSRADRQRSRSVSLAKGPSLMQFQMMVRQHPAATVIDKRNRAVIACTGLIGARVSALASLRIKHVNSKERLVLQDADEVRTKNRKTTYSWFFPVGDDIAEFFLDWVEFLQNDELFGPDDPLFPSSHVRQGHAQKFEVAGITKKPWSSAAPIERIFREVGKSMNLPHINPHSVRNMLARLGYDRCEGNLKALKVWSQNLGHEKMVTTYMGYGAISPEVQGEVMKGFWGDRPIGLPDSESSERSALLRRLLELETNPLIGQD